MRHTGKVLVVLGALSGENTGCLPGGVLRIKRDLSLWFLYKNRFETVFGAGAYPGIS